MKKHLPATAAVAVAAVAASLALAAPSAVGAAPAPATATTTTVAVPARTVTAPAPARIRTVHPGERVDAGRGYTVWLTREGKHWNGPEEYENFRSVVDGNIDRSEPGVSHQSEGTAEGVFHSGLYYGTTRAGRVELTGSGGRRTVATLLALPGRPDWGVWYAHTPAPTGKEGLAVALYDRRGALLADLPAGPF
ncbi:hypothetical protein ACFYNX_21450 [Streptomyces sp. NPDC007872]|uniref:hypothetical protein n=1 Tax=Streptomyces sp. NPDC007872 TaxID=3364782 RepID=UPI0036B472F2